MEICCDEYYLLSRYATRVPVSSAVVSSRLLNNNEEVRERCARRMTGTKEKESLALFCLLQGSAVTTEQEL